MGGKQHEVDNAIKRYNDEIAHIRQRITVLGELQNKQCGAVYVSVVAPAPAETEINLKYMVDDAAWTPFYEVRVSGSAPSSLQLLPKMIVMQKTNEDWNKVPLTVMLSNPKVSNSLPRLQRYSLPGARLLLPLWRRRCGGW